MHVTQIFKLGPHLSSSFRTGNMFIIYLLSARRIRYKVRNP